jgi:uncharacterized protein YbjT (DUF2867 family)
MHTLVTGATGFVGGRLVPALLDAGHEVTVFVRDPERYDPPTGVRVVVGDLLDPESITAAVDGVDAAYYLVHSMSAHDDFAARDRRAAANFADAAGAAGVDRVIYLGGLGEERDHLSAHLRSRREVERVLAAGDYALTTLRAAIVVGARSAGFEMVVQLAARLPVMVTPRWVRTPCQPVAAADVIAYLVGVLDVPETAGETYDVGGPEVLTYVEMLRRTGRHLGREPIIVAVPVLTPRLSAYWVGLMTDVPWSLARPLIAGLKNPVVVDDDRLAGLVPVEPTSFDEAVRRALTDCESAGVGA